MKGGRELQKVFGILALFSTAYVVGSSAHYTVRPTAGYSDTLPIATSNRGYQPKQERQ